MKKVLIVDDDVIACNMIRKYLESEHFVVYVTHSGEETLNFVKNDMVDIIILDLMLPGIDGIEVCKEIKSKESIPIIMLTAKGHIEDRVKGLNIGADDYMVKPFAPVELMARIQAVLRRDSLVNETKHSFPLSQNNIITYDNLVINTDSFEVSIGGKKIIIPKREYQLLEFFSKNPNKVFNREKLIELIWGWDFEAKDRTVDVYIQRLRKRLKTDKSVNWSIRTLWGIGYKFEVKL